ncbi:MAG TPA: glycosyltransferase, partial [Bdellovibrionota bacterium]
MVEKLKLSVLILARNEEAWIARAIESCREHVSEIVVVDANSTDRTREIALSLGARVVQREWTGFGDQRNFSLLQARHDWVLVLDADEAVTPGLWSWLEMFFREGIDKVTPYGYKIRRAEYFLGRQIHGACWNPSYQDRFFRRDKAKYVGVIHEYPIVEGGFVRAPESAFLEHNPSVSAESFFDKMNRYTSIEALDRYRAGQRTSLAHMGVTFFSTWFKNFFYYKGYRDGAHGFVICLMEAVSRTVRHIKLWQIQRMHEEGRQHLLPAATVSASPRALEAR